MNIFFLHKLEKVPKKLKKDMRLDFPDFPDTVNQLLFVINRRLTALRQLIFAVKMLIVTNIIYKRNLREIFAMTMLSRMKVGL